MTGGAGVLGGVDRAAFVVGLADRLRRAGVAVSVGAIEACTVALGSCVVDRKSRLYWLTRTTLVHDHADLDRFDRVFAAVFDGATNGVDPHARRTPSVPRNDDDRLVHAPGARAEVDAAGLPWATRPVVRAGLDETADDGEQQLAVPRPSELERLAEVPFDQLDREELRALDLLLAAALQTWPQRRSRRTRHPAGARLDLRRTLHRSRRSGFEPVALVHHRPISRPRRLVVLCDVSQSMHPHTNAYLHLMRAAVRGAGVEAFAIGTSLTRLTPVLAHHDPDEAVALASALVADRHGGTRIATNLRALLRSRHADAVRGAVVVIASDGWDADPPEAMAAAMERLTRRAHRVLWLNPRAAAPGFEPRTNAMAAALPLCHQMVPGDRLAPLLAALASL